MHTIKPFRGEEKTRIHIDTSFGIQDIKSLLHNVPIRAFSFTRKSHFTQLPQKLTFLYCKHIYTKS